MVRHVQMRSLAHLVLARWIESAPITVPYLQKLLAYMRREDDLETSVWRGSWSQAINLLQRWLRQLQSNDTYEPPKTVGELFEALAAREALDPTLLTQLRSIPVPKVKAPKPAVTFYDAYRELEKVSGKPVIYESTLEHRPDAPERVLGWVRALKKLKGPAKRAFHTVVHKIHLSNKPRGSEDASWDLQGKLRLVIKNLDISVDSLIYYVTHELGHGVEEKYGIDLFAAPWGQPPFISAYAESKPNIEDFAESFAHYALSPSELLAKAQPKYEALKALAI